jgi:hypothetical protein
MRDEFEELSAAFHNNSSAFNWEDREKKDERIEEEIKKEGISMWRNMGKNQR